MQILQHNNMKYILIFSILFLEMAACQNTGESAAASKEGIKTGLAGHCGCPAWLF